MACIKSAARSALVTFAPDAPYMAAGTMAGAVDLSFSSSANLEIFKLDFQSDAYDLPVAGACPSTERFNRLSWGKPHGSPSEEYSFGLIAGGLSDGSIGVWNPAKLISGSLGPLAAPMIRIMFLFHDLRSTLGQFAVWSSMPFHQTCWLLGRMKGSSASGIWQIHWSLTSSLLLRMLAQALKLKFLLYRGIPSFNLY